MLNNMLMVLLPMEHTGSRQSIAAEVHNIHVQQMRIY